MNAGSTYTSDVDASNIPRFTDLLSKVANHGYQLVSIYPSHYRENKTAWTNALFVSPGYGVERN